MQVNKKDLATYFTCCYWTVFKMSTKVHVGTF